MTLSTPLTQRLHIRHPVLLGPMDVVADSRRNVWPAPFTGRCLRNPHLERWFGREVELLRDQDNQAAKYAAARADGAFDIAAVIAGECVGLIHDILPAAMVIEDMVGDAVRLLQRGPAEA